MESSHRLAALMQRKRTIKPVYVHVWIPPALYGATPEWINAACMRALMSMQEGIADTMLSAREALFSAPSNRGQFPAFAGETVFAVEAWSAHELVSCLESANPAGPSHAVASDVGFPAHGSAWGDFQDLPVDRLSVLGLASGFEPGQFTRASLTLRLPPDIFPNPQDRLIQFLRGSYVACNLRKSGARYVLEIPPKSAKKKSVFGGEMADSAWGFEMVLSIGPKFSLAGFLAMFGDRAAHLAAQVVFSDLVW